MIADIEERTNARQQRRQAWEYQPADLNERVFSGTKLYAAIRRLKIEETKPALYWHPDRVMLYTLTEPKKGERDRGDEDLDDDEDEDRRYFQPIGRYLIPKLKALIAFQEGDALKGQRLCYLIEANGKEVQATHEELKKGECWELFPGSRIFSPRQIAKNALIVDDQVSLFPGEIPTHQGRRDTGWMITKDNRHALIIPTGALWGADGEVQGERVYLNIKASHIDPYRNMTIDRTIEAQRAALAFIGEMSKKSIHPLLLCANLRSLMDGIVHAGMSLAFRGPNSLGKTLSCDFLLNLMGDFPYRAQVTTAESTRASLEKHLAQIKSLLALVDDITIRPGMRETEKQDMAGKFEAIVRSVYNGSVVKERQTNRMGDQVANRITCVPIITCEELLPSLAESTKNRMLIIGGEAGDIDKDRVFAEGDQYKPGLRAIGYGFVSFIARLWDNQGEEFSTYLESRHAAIHKDLSQRLAAVYPGGILPDKATRLPVMGSDLILAAQLLIEYCADQGFPCPLDIETMITDLINHLLKQIDIIFDLDGGGEGEPLHEKILNALRLALAEHSAYLIKRDNALLKAEDMPEGYTLDDAGMERSGLVEYDAPKRATRIGKMDRTEGYIYLTPDLAYQSIRRHMKPEPTKRQCWECLDRAGLILRGEGDHFPRKLGAGQRCIFLSIAALYPNDDTPDDNDAGGCPVEAQPAPSSSTPAAGSAPDYPPDLIEQMLGADVASPEAAALSSYKPPPPGALCPNCGSSDGWRVSQHQLDIGGDPWCCKSCNQIYHVALRNRETQHPAEKGVKNHG